MRYSSKGNTAGGNAMAKVGAVLQRLKMIAISGHIVRVCCALILSFALLLAAASPVAACIIKVSPSATSGTVGDTISVTINVQLTHRNCLVPINDTEIKLTGMEMVSQTSWQMIQTNQYKKEIKVKLTKSGQGKIEVIRDCSLGGGDTIATIAIAEAKTAQPSVSSQTPPATQLPSPPSAPSQPTTPPPSDAPLSGEEQPSEQSSAELTWGDAFRDGITQPTILGMWLLTILAAAGMMLRFRRFRYLILLGSLAFLGFATGGCPCALGALQKVFIHLGTIKEKLPSYLLIGIPILTSLFLGRLFCGWVCPMGAAQHFVYRKELLKKGQKIDLNWRNHRLLRYLKYLKYLILIILIVAVLITQDAVFEDIDPFKALFNLNFTLLTPTLILIVLMIIALFIGFPFCKYLCPLGALLSLFARISLFKVKIGEKCTNCKACHTMYCDYGAIVPGEPSPHVDRFECVSCGECISRCPHGAIDFTRK